MDKNPNDAGTYILKDGKRTLVEPVTADHPDGNCARPAEDDLPVAEPAAPGSLADRLKAKIKGDDK